MYLNTENIRDDDNKRAILILYTTLISNWSMNKSYIIQSDLCNPIAYHVAIDSTMSGWKKLKCQPCEVFHH